MEVECCYQSPVFLETDDINERDKQFIQNCLYRQELLNIFYLEEFDDILINKKMSALYEKIKECKEINDIIKVWESEGSIDTVEVGLMILFSYDYMYLAHLCISEFLKNGKVNEYSIELLRNAVT